MIDPFEAGDRLPRESWALNFFQQVKAEAVLLGPLDADRYKLLEKELAAIPRLVVFDALDPLPVSHVGLDMPGSCRMAMEYLYRAEHRRIGYLGLNRFDAASDSPFTRYALYRAFLAEHRLEFRDDWIIRTSAAGPEPEMLDAVKRLLTGEHRVTALLCHEDAFGLLALKAAAECGIAVPEDLSVIGFDDQPSAWLAHPGLTTIHFDINSYVDKLVEFTLEAVNTPAGSVPPVRQYREQPRLVVRDSVARITHLPV
ncbi:HTH-type transcriptional repressor PurR [bioreactor metagenome]|uniref:HTH-type transcriptional repressor PurR n=1 Tax=bioreactor metagenome TaxID=1076179 RepID=A0A645F9C9_9ZZZZ